MKIVVVGAGAVGGYFGALLAKAGNEVGFVARGAQLMALRERGLRLTGARGEVVIGPCVASENPSDLGPAEVVLLGVKLYDVDAAGAAIAPLMAGGGMCISLQNGVDAPLRLARYFGVENILGGIAYMSGVVAEPGVIRYTTDFSHIVYGELDKAVSRRALDFQRLCKDAGFGAEISEDIQQAQWSKFVGMATHAALSCIVRQPAGVLFHTPELLDLARRGFEEARAVGLAERVSLANDIVEQHIKMHCGFPPGMYASMYHDLRQGRRLELESLSGLIVRKGREHGIATPVHEFAYAALKPYLDGEPRNATSPG